MSPDDGVVVQLPGHLTAVEALFARPPGEYWDIDGVPISRELWLRLVTDADYRVLAVHRFDPEVTGGPRVSVRTEWAGEDLRPNRDLGRRPLIWQTQVSGIALARTKWQAARRQTATFLHGHAIGMAAEALSTRRT